MRKALLLLLLAGACEERDLAPTKGARPDHYAIGRTPSAAEIAAVNIDVNPAGAGLPAGQGTVAQGAAIFAGKCSACHGPHGEGIPPNPKLIGTQPPAGYAFGKDAKAPKTIGNYWPYATTLYDYIHRAMPLNAPGSLTPDEIYGVVAFLLAQNGVVGDTVVMNAKTLPAVRMPEQSRFVKDNRTGGQGFK